MDTQLYTHVMQKIKGRKEYIDSVMNNVEALGKVSIYMVESICLQLRMTIEDIAVACVVANAHELPDLAHSLRGEYRPARILKELERMNPDCYPIPIVENVEGSHGNFRDTHHRHVGDWLTREEAVQEYGRLNNALHRNLKAYAGAPNDIGDLYQKCSYLEFKIRNLLSHHHITVLDENTMYRVLMSGTGVNENGVRYEGRIQVAPFIRVPEDMEQTAMRGEVSVNDITSALRTREGEN